MSTIENRAARQCYHKDTGRHVEVRLNYEDERSLGATEKCLMSEQGGNGLHNALSQGDLHDLRNFLCAISASAELITKDIEEGSTARSRINMIAAAARNAIRLVHPKGNTREGGDRYIPRPSDVVRETITFLKSFRGPQILVNYTLDEEISSLAVGVSNLQRIVMNPYINACQAIGSKPGTITIILRTALSSGKRYASLEVTDTGPGMDPETMTKIFLPEFTTKTNGQGLGLATAEDIVRKHGGSLRVRSSKGSGAAFTVRLPCLAIP